MSYSRFLATALAVAALFTFSTATAQVNDPGQRQTPEAQAPQAQQDRGAEYQVQRVSPAQRGQAKTVQQVLLDKLRMANTAEIELAKLALEKAEHEQLQQLAQTMIQEHQALNQEIEQFTGHAPPEGRQASRDRVGQSTEPQPRSQQLARGAMAATVPPELCQIMEQAHKNVLQMTKQTLSQLEGQDFQMGFLSQQIVAHTMLLAELKAMESAGPQEIQPIVQTAIQKTESHLKEAKQLAKKLEDEERQQRS